MSVFHIKYRPSKIADLDLAQVRDTLNKIFESKETPQSFLFCGPKGSGKTSAARIVAKIVNCKKPKGGEACGKCHNCQLIEAGGMGLDVMEMDAASNRGIDDIRALKEKIFLSPVNLTSKVFVIDEVHMLTKEAFNALLKILEEPPQNVYFVLCTTNPEKIPETVLSRLVRVDFRKGTIGEVVGSLKKVIKGEEIKLGKSEEVILEEIASLSDGSFRNAQKILMELVMDKGNKIDEKEWQKFRELKFSSGAYGGVMMEKDLSQGRVKVILGQLEELVKSGVDMSLYRQRLIEYFQKRLVNFYSKQDESDLSLEELSSFLKLLIQAGREEKEAVLAQLPLQLAVVDFGQEYGDGDGGKSKKIEEKKIKIDKVKIKKVETMDKSMNYGISVEDVKKNWKQLLVTVRPYNHSVEAFLRSAQPVRVEGNKLIAEVFYKFHKERLEDDRNRLIVEKSLQELFSVPILFECELASKIVRPMDVDDGHKNEEEMYDVAKEIFGS